MHYDALSPDLAARLVAGGAAAAERLLLDINRLALALLEQGDEPPPGAPTARVKLGVYLIPRAGARPAATADAGSGFLMKPARLLLAAHRLLAARLLLAALLLLSGYEPAARTPEMRRAERHPADRRTGLPDRRHWRPDADAAIGNRALLLAERDIGGTGAGGAGRRQGQGLRPCTPPGGRAPWTAIR